MLGDYGCGPHGAAWSSFTSCFMSSGGLRDDRPAQARLLDEAEKHERLAVKKWDSYRV
jgi:hypothetical protein